MEDELMQEDGLELDPMPGDELEQMPDPATPDPAQDLAPEQGFSPEDRRRLAESLILEDPELKDTYLRGLAASQAPQQAQEPEQDPYQQLIGDPAMEFLGNEVRALKQQLEQERAEKQAMQATQQFIAQTEADPEIAQQLQAVPGIGLALTQMPEFAALMSNLVKRAGSAKKHDQAVAGSIKPPTVVGQGSAQAGDLGVTGKAQKLKQSLSGKDGYKNFTDKDWKELAAAEEGVK
jgi:predicted secreted protein